MIELVIQGGIVLHNDKKVFLYYKLICLNNYGVDMCILDSKIVTYFFVGVLLRLLMGIFVSHSICVIYPTMLGVVVCVNGTAKEDSDELFPGYEQTGVVSPLDLEDEFVSLDHEGYVSVVLGSGYQNIICQLVQKESVLKDQVEIYMQANLDLNQAIEQDFEADSESTTMDDIVITKKDVYGNIKPNDIVVNALFQNGIMDFHQGEYESCLSHMKALKGYLHEFDRVQKKYRLPFTHSVEYWTSKYYMAMCHQYINENLSAAGNLICSIISHSHSDGIGAVSLDRKLVSNTDTDMGPCGQEELETQILSDLRKRSAIEGLSIAAKLISGVKISFKEVNGAPRMSTGYALAEKIANALIPYSDSFVHMHAYLLRGVARMKQQTIEKIKAGQRDIDYVITHAGVYGSVAFKQAIAAKAESYCMLQKLCPCDKKPILDTYGLLEFLEYSKKNNGLIGQEESLITLVKQAHSFVQEVYAWNLLKEMKGFINRQGLDKSRECINLYCSRVKKWFPYTTAATEATAVMAWFLN